MMCPLILSVLLLCGCQAEKAVVGVSPAVSTPAPVEEGLTVNGETDFFEGDINYRLRLVGESDGEWKPMRRLELWRAGESAPYFTVDADALDETVQGDGGVTVEDMNFDGWPDFRIHREDYYIGVTWYCWLYDPETAAFVRAPELEDLPNPWFDAGEKRIYTIKLFADGDRHGRGVYGWEGGVLHLLDEPYRQPPEERLLKAVSFPVEREGAPWFNVRLEARLREDGGEFDSIRIMGVVTSGEDPGRVVQSFEHTAYEEFLDRWYVEDVNFDDWPDFYYEWSEGTANRYYIFWVWNPELEEFVENHELEELSLPGFHAGDETVTSHARGSAVHFVDGIYHWVDGKLTLMRTLWVDGGFEDLELVVTDYLDGELYRAPHDAGFEEFDRYYDLSYHGK